MKLFRISVLLALVGVFTSCAKDEDPDFVAESLGTYSYSTKVTRANKDTPDNYAGTLTLSRDEEGVTVIIDDFESMKSSQLELTSNGYGFKIEPATLTDSDGNLVDRKGRGHSAFISNPSIYHGEYYAHSKQLYIKASYTYQDSRYVTYNFIAEITARRK